jgi:cytochrome c peroxidase
VGERLFADDRFSQPSATGRGGAVSCQTCHFSAAKDQGPRAFCDFQARSLVPDRGDGRRTTPRNSPTLLDALEGNDGTSLLHFDGQFATADELVRETFTGRNFGWLPTERAEARRHFARVIRDDDGRSAPADAARLSYAALLRGTSPAIPAALRLPSAARMDVGHASDEEILAGCSRLVVMFLKTLRFSRDAGGDHNGSAYDEFLAANRLPRGPRGGETAREYARRLGEQIAALRAPRYVSSGAARENTGDAAASFGELELRGARIFFRSAVGTAQTSGAGNCAECHVPPHFTDFKFHNTGAAQDEFDAMHGAGAFERLQIPSRDERAKDHDRWLEPSSLHPNASGILFSPAEANSAGRTDLGLWNVYANPDFPEPQAAIEQLLNANGRLSRDEALTTAAARFKTSTVRGLGLAAPYLHTGRLATIEDVVVFYKRMSDLAHDGALRNAPPEFFAMRIGPDDVAPLAAFLRSLNEPIPGPRPAP